MPRRKRHPRSSPGQGSVILDSRRHGAKRFRARVTLEGGRRPERYFATEADAWDWCDARLHTATSPPVETRTVAELCRLWWETIVPADAPANTRNTYRNHMERRIVPSLGEHPVTALRPQQVQEWIAQMQREGVSAHTIKGARRVLIAILGVAEDWEWITRNPATRTKAPVARPVTTITTPSAADMLAILRATEGTEVELIFLLCCVYGLRQGEALGLRWQDIDERAITIRGQLEQGSRQFVERTKTRRPRVLPLIPLVVDRLAAWPRRSDELVSADAGGRPYARSTVHSIYRKALRDAGLPHRRPHDLRRGVATLLHDLGIPLETRKAIVGHLDTATHGDYIEVGMEAKRAAMERLGAALGNGRGRYDGG